MVSQMLVDLAAAASGVTHLEMHVMFPNLVQCVEQVVALLLDLQVAYFFLCSPALLPHILVRRYVSVTSRSALSTRAPLKGEKHSANQGEGPLFFSERKPKPRQAPLALLSRARCWWEATRRTKVVSCSFQNKVGRHPSCP